MRLADLAGRKVAIWGTGREGIAAAQAIAAVGPASLVAADDNPTRDTASWLDATGGVVPLITGPDAYAALAAAEVVVRSPGVPQVHPWLPGLSEHGVTFTSGTALWMAEHADHTIAVTGTKGKSTTSALIHHLLTGLGLPATFAGNIGTPVLETEQAQGQLPGSCQQSEQVQGQLPGSCQQGLHVVELSSHQCHSLTDSPAWAVLTSLFPEHLDWHGGTDEYYRAKLNLIAHEPRAVVINGCDDTLVTQVAATAQPELPVIAAGLPEEFHLSSSNGSEQFYLGTTPLFPRTTLPLLGQHNARNLCVALSLLAAVGIDCVAQRTRIAGVLGTFAGLAHRLQPVADPAGRFTFVNDSLSTAPQSAIAALESFADDSVTLILGGTDRGLDYRVLRDYLADTRNAPITVLTIPDSGPRIAAALRDVPGITIESVPDLDTAVARARALTPPGGVVLLSPAAPSYGRFTDHAHRATVFANAITTSAASTFGT